MNLSTIGKSLEHGGHSPEHRVNVVPKLHNRVTIKLHYISLYTLVIALFWCMYFLIQEYKTWHTGRIQYEVSLHKAHTTVLITVYYA